MSPILQIICYINRYFATGDLCRHIASCYRISKQHFGTIVSHVSQAICKALKSQVPECNEQTMSAVAKGYEEKWNFPNCVGAIDGKHIAIRAPPKSGSIFYNYKASYIHMYIHKNILKHCMNKLVFLCMENKQLFL